jgi:hypothetical protein
MVGPLVGNPSRSARARVILWPSGNVTLGQLGDGGFTISKTTVHRIPVGHQLSRRRPA